MKIGTLLALLLLSLCISAQVYKKDIPELLKLNSYSKDKDADAFYVYDKGESKFVEGVDGLELIFRRSFRIKVLNEDGIDYAEIFIPLYSNGFELEEVNQLNVTVYNQENGEITQLKSTKKDLLQEQLSSNWIAKKMKISGVKAGSVIDVGYRVNSPFLFNLADWTFQHEIPVAFSLYKTAMIPFYTYTYILKGTNQLDIANSYVSDGLPRNMYGIEFKEMIFNFGLYDVKAFKDASFITCEEDYKITLDFQLTSYRPTSGGEVMVMSTWDKLITDLLKENRFGRYQKSVKKLAKSIIEENEIIDDKPRKTIENAVNFVKTNFVWDNKYGYFSNRSAKELKKLKTGNSTALNLLLVALLQEAGIESYPLLISTRDHGKIYSDYPFAHYFNYTVAISMVNGEEILSDATEPYANYDQLPSRCLNDKGLLVRRKTVDWVKINTPVTTSTSDYFEIDLSNDSMIVKYNYKSKGYEAIKDYRSFEADSSRYKERISSNLFDNLTSSNLIENSKANTFSILQTGEKKIEKIENYVSINPFLKFFSSENPFTERERDYPIDFIYPRTVTYLSIIKLPENAKVITLPDDKTISNEAFDLSYNVVTTGQQISVSMNYSFKKSIYPKEYYLKFKEYFDEYLNVMAQAVQIELSN